MASFCPGMNRNQPYRNVIYHNFGFGCCSSDCHVIIAHTEIVRDIHIAVVRIRIFGHLSRHPRLVERPRVVELHEPVTPHLHIRHAFRQQADMNTSNVELFSAQRLAG